MAVRFPRACRVIVFDGQPTDYIVALERLLVSGVKPSISLDILDDLPVVGFTDKPMVDRHLENVQKAGELLKKGARHIAGRAGEIAKKTGESARQGAKKTGEVAGKVASGAAEGAKQAALKTAEVAKKTGEAVKKAGEEVEKATGGGDDDCVWRTISGPRGTTKICIDHEGNIKIGPRTLAGQPASTLSKDKGMIERARGEAKLKKEMAEKREKTVSNHVRNWADRADDILGVASGFLSGDIGATIGATMTKFLGDRIGWINKATTGLRNWMVNRYGEKATTGIVLAGMASMKLADAFVLPGIGTAIGFLPGGHLVSALPVVAAIEGCKLAGREGKRIASSFKGIMDHIKNANQSIKKNKSGKKARFSGGKASVADRRGEALTEKDVQRLGRQFMKKLTERIQAEWKKHQGEWSKIAAKVRKSMKKARKKERSGDKKRA